MTAGRRPEYFLSCYLSPPGEMSVLLLRHDQGIALWRRTDETVELVRLWELERLSGQKHHYWPMFTHDHAEAVLEELLSREGLTLSDLTAVWGAPGLPKSAGIVPPPGSEPFPMHSLAHLFSGLLCDTDAFREATIVGLAVDGGPDFTLDRTTKRYWYAGCVSRQGALTFAPVESPGPLYSACRILFGSEPGTLMALASACDTAIEFDAATAVKSIRLFGGTSTSHSVALPFVRSILAEARRQLPAAPADDRFTPEEHVQSAVMAAVQECCQLIMVRNVQHLCELADVRPRDAYLSTSGGFALNCPTNSFLVNFFGFRGLLTPPCANDSGQPLGLGMLGLYGLRAFDRARFRMTAAHYGSPVTDLEEALAEFASWVEATGDYRPEQFVADVTTEPVAWVDGGSEVGPRALGNRSLLGDPRSPATKDVLNRWKRRQWWRPVAPIVLAEHVAEWFEATRPSPFMLETAQIRQEVRSRVPAIAHLDGSARYQSMSQDVNPRLHQAIEAFRQATGVPILCNTSLNDKGEPIVDTVAQALTFCIRRGVRVAYVAGRRVVLRLASADRPAPERPRDRNVHWFAEQEAERDKIWAAWRDHGYTLSAMYLLARSPDLRLAAASGKVTPVHVNSLADHEAETDRAFAFSVERFGSMFGPGSFFDEQPGEPRARPAELED
jgi:carbamoyltransferase